MYVEHERLVLSPSDLVGYLHCGHLTELSLAVVTGSLERPSSNETEPSVVQRRGIEHEKSYLRSLASSEVAISEIPESGGLAARVDATMRALMSGSDVVYQAAFSDNSGPGPVWIGYADFLTKLATPSNFGEFSYEAEDTKLARHVRPSAVLQLCSYSEHLQRLQGVKPQQIHVVLGGLGLTRFDGQIDYAA